MDSPATISIESASIRLGIGRNLAYSLARAGKLPGVLRLGRRLVVSRVQLENYLEGKDQPEREGTVPSGT